MTNHFHLFLRTPEANISRALQWINSVYTQRCNRRHRRGGHLFQGRFKSVLVIEQAFIFINLFGYGISLSKFSLHQLPGIPVNADSA
ncbi:MAG TPA: transposase [bacterium]|nr:transposase [bacterium]